jgi:hypothetical protein
LKLEIFLEYDNFRAEVKAFFKPFEPLYTLSKIFIRQKWGIVDL